MLSTQSCELFNQPFFQFAQIKKFQPERLQSLKQEYQQAWQQWKALIQQVSAQLGAPFAKPHIESWTNGWQVRSHFFAFFKYEYYQHSAAILSVILNRRRLQVCLDWHSYRANRSQFTLEQYNQWLEQLDYQQYGDFEIWRGDDSEYNDFPLVKKLSPEQFILPQPQDFYCIGKNCEKAQLDHIDSQQFICQTIRQLLPLYEKCHQAVR